MVVLYATEKEVLAWLKAPKRKKLWSGANESVAPRPCLYLAANRQHSVKDRGRQQCDLRLLPKMRWGIRLFRCVSKRMVEVERKAARTATATCLPNRCPFWAEVLRGAQFRSAPRALLAAGHRGSYTGGPAMCRSLREGSPQRAPTWLFKPRLREMQAVTWMQLENVFVSASR